MQYVEADVTVTVKVRVALENEYVDPSLRSLRDDIGDELHDSLVATLTDEKMSWGAPFTVDAETVDGEDCEVPCGIDNTEVREVIISAVREFEPA